MDLKISEHKGNAMNECDTKSENNHAPKRKISNTDGEECLKTKKPKLDGMNELPNVSSDAEKLITSVQPSTENNIEKMNDDQDCDDCDNEELSEQEVILTSNDEKENMLETTQKQTGEKPKRIEAKKIPKLYRLLGEDERIEHGLSAKDPTARKEVAYHVASGSSVCWKSQFISTCSSRGSAETFRQLKMKSSYKYGNKDIAEIDVGSLPDDVKIIDLTEAILRQQFEVKDEETNKKFHKYAQSHSEVLLTGNVPSSCLTRLEFTGTVPISDSDSDSDSDASFDFDRNSDDDDDWF